MLENGLYILSIPYYHDMVVMLYSLASIVLVKCNKFLFLYFNSVIWNSTLWYREVLGQLIVVVKVQGCKPSVMVGKMVKSYQGLVVSMGIVYMKLWILPMNSNYLRSIVRNLNCSNELYLFGETMFIKGTLSKFWMTVPIMKMSLLLN